MNYTRFRKRQRNIISLNKNRTSDSSLPIWEQRTFGWLSVSTGIASLILAIVVAGNKQDIKDMEKLLSNQNKQLTELIKLNRNQQIEINNLGSIQKSISDQIIATKDQTVYLQDIQKPNLAILGVEVKPIEGKKNGYFYTLPIKNNGNRDAYDFKAYLNFFFIDTTTRIPILRVPSQNRDAANSVIKVGETNAVNCELGASDAQIKIIKESFVAIEFFYVDPLNKKKIHEITYKKMRNFNGNLLLESADLFSSLQMKDYLKTKKLL